MLAMVHNDRLFAEAQLLSHVNLKASDEWDSLRGNLSDEGFLLFVFVLFFFPYFFLLCTVRKIYELL